LLELFGSLTLNEIFGIRFGVALGLLGLLSLAFAFSLPLSLSLSLAPMKN